MSKNLNRETVRLLRKIQKFLIAEPRRFDMHEGIARAEDSPTLLETPPCGTACCIAGAGYAIERGIKLNHSQVYFNHITYMFADPGGKFKLDSQACDRLFYIKQQIGYGQGWPIIYSNAYKEAKTPLERACVGVARIEHFIATDGQE